VLAKAFDKSGVRLIECPPEPGIKDAAERVVTAFHMAKGIAAAEPVVSDD